MHGGPFHGLVITNTPIYTSCGNITVAAIHQMLRMSADKVEEINADPEAKQKMYWPDNLHLQMDNSGKDNKNK